MAVFVYYFLPIWTFSDFCLLQIVLFCCGFPTTTDTIYLHGEGVGAANPDIKQCCNLSIPLLLVVILIKS